MKTGLNHQHFNYQTVPGKYDMEGPNKSLFQTVPIVAVLVQVLTIHFCMLHLLVDVEAKVAAVTFAAFTVIIQLLETRKDAAC